MAAKNNFSLLILLLLVQLFYSGRAELQMNYYAKSCPKAEEIIKQQVTELYYEHGNTAVSWLRNLFHDCVVQSCDASLLLETTVGVESEKDSDRSFGMRNFKYVNKIKVAVENACPQTVSCADIVALSARDGIVMLKGPHIDLKTGRRDSKMSYSNLVEELVPKHNESLVNVLSRFKSIGIDTEATVALLGAHSVGRVHCVNLVERLYPTVDRTIDPKAASSTDICGIDVQALYLNDPGNKQEPVGYVLCSEMGNTCMKNGCGCRRAANAEVGGVTKYFGVCIQLQKGALTYYTQCCVIASDVLGGGTQCLDLPVRGGLRVAKVELSDMTSFGLKITSYSGRVLYVQAGDQESREQWLKVLKEAPLARGEMMGQVPLRRTMASDLSTQRSYQAEASSPYTHMAMSVLSSDDGDDAQDCDMQGYLYMRGGLLPGSKKRFMTLTDGHLTIRRSRSQRSSDPQEADKQFEVISATRWSGRPHGLCIRLENHKELYVYAEHDVDASMWLEALKSC